jgi:hypothetical protein
MSYDNRAYYVAETFIKKCLDALLKPIVRIQPKSCRLANMSVAALAKGGYLALQNDL